tara:strand:- start:5 stop:238 length:234 start_codon:yes stop_codon:yes gene_type:complete
MIDLNLCDKQQAQALLQIKETGNDQLPSLLRAEAETAKAKLVTATDTVSIHRLQGRAEAFEDLLTAIEDSPKVVKRL